MIVGIYIDNAIINYANENYQNLNTTYIKTSIEDYKPVTKEFDCIVSRHSVEHITNNINLILSFDYG